MESPVKFRITSNKSLQASPRKEERRGSLDSLDGDLKSLKSAPKSARLRFLQATESHPSGPRKPTPRPSPAALSTVENEEKKGDDGGDLTLSQKNRLERLLKTLRKSYNDMATRRMKGLPVDDSALLKLHADIEDTERALTEVAVGLCDDRFFEALSSVLIGRVLAIGASTDDAHAGMLDQSDYNHFWATLCDQDAATQFMAASLDKLVTLRTSRARTEAPTVAAVQSLTRTVLFVSLFYDVDCTLAVERGVKAWQKSLTDGHPPLPLEEVVCDLVYRQYVDDENVTEPLLLLCVLPGTGAGAVMAPPCPYTNHWSINTPDDVPFVYIVIESLAKQGYDLECLYDTVVNLMLKLPAHRAAHPVLVNSALTSLLFVFRELLSCHPVPDPAFLLCTLPVLSSIMNTFPSPLGTTAAAILDGVTREVLSPGWNYRSTLLKERPLLGRSCQSLWLTEIASACQWAALQSCGLFAYSLGDVRAVTLRKLYNTTGSSMRTADIAVGITRVADDEDPALQEWLPRQLIIDTILLLLELDINLGTRLVTVQSVLEHATAQQLRQWLHRAIDISDAPVIAAWNSALARVRQGCTDAAVESEAVGAVTALPAGFESVGVMLDPVTAEDAKACHITRKAGYTRLIAEMLDELIGEALHGDPEGVSAWKSSQWYTGSDFEHPEGGNLCLDHMPDLPHYSIIFHGVFDSETPDADLTPLRVEASSGARSVANWLAAQMKFNPLAERAPVVPSSVLPEPLQLGATPEPVVPHAAANIPTAPDTDDILDGLELSRSGDGGDGSESEAGEGDALSGVLDDARSSTSGRKDTIGGADEGSSSLGTSPQASPDIISFSAKSKSTPSTVTSPLLKPAEPQRTGGVFAFMSSAVTLHGNREAPRVFGGFDGSWKRFYSPWLTVPSGDTFGCPLHVQYPPGAVRYYSPAGETNRILQLLRSCALNVPDGASSAPTAVDMPILRLIVTSEVSMHRITAALAVLHQTHLQLLQSVDVRLYVVPTSLCSAGTYLAIIDPWYRRQVYSPFQSGINVLPKLQLTDDDADYVESEPPRGDIVTPTTLMRMAMDVYLRSATQRVRVHMMEVECWRTLNTEGGVSTRRMSLDVDALNQRPDVVIPFCCYVDIGVTTNVQKYPTQENAKWLDIVEDKDFVRSGGLSTPDLVVTMRLTDPHHTVKRLERSPYTSILVSNMPNMRDGAMFKQGVSGATGVPAPPRASTDPHTAATQIPRVMPKVESVLGECPDPSDPWVDVRLVNSRLSKNYAPMLPKRTKNKSLDALNDACESDAVHHQAYIVDIRCSTRTVGVEGGGGFAIVVDGQLHGTYSRVRISSCKTAPYPLQVPLMTFVPPIQHRSGVNTADAAAKRLDDD